MSSVLSLTKERPLSCLPQGPLACHYLHCCIVALQPLPGPVMTEEDRTLIPAGSLCACVFDGLVRERQETLGLEAMDAVSKGPLLPPAVPLEGFIHVCGREVAAQYRGYGGKALGSISTPVYRKSQCRWVEQQKWVWLSRLQSCAVVTHRFSCTCLLTLQHPQKCTQEHAGWDSYAPHVRSPTYALCRQVYSYPIYTYTHTHTHIQTLTLSHIHTDTSYSHTFTHIYAYTQTLAHTFKHTYITQYANTHTYSHACLHTHTVIQTLRYTYIHIALYTYILKQTESSCMHE